MYAVFSIAVWFKDSFRCVVPFQLGKVVIVKDDSSAGRGSASGEVQPARTNIRTRQARKERCGYSVVNTLLLWVEPYEALSHRWLLGVGSVIAITVF